MLRGYSLGLWSGDDGLMLSFAWTIGLLVVVAPLAVRRYRAIER